MKPFDLRVEALEAADREVIDGILEDHNRDGTELVGILLDVEAAMERHYISREAAMYIAGELDLKPTHVYDVISFYAELHDKPRARYPIQVCDSAPCRVRESRVLLETLKALLHIEENEVTYDGRFTIERVPCFGACDVAPAVRVNGVVYGHLDSRESILAFLRHLD